MKERKEVVKFINKQLDSCSDDAWEAKEHKLHYGRHELKELMDFMYEEEPTCEEEFILGGSHIK